MKCNRCGKETDYYYMAGPVALCEDCACTSVAVLSDEGLFPFIDNVIPAGHGDGAAAEPANEIPVPTEVVYADTDSAE